MGRYLEQVFGAGGILARAFDGYEPRPGQIALAKAVDAAVRSGKSVIAEAPTGTGKSIGYLVPAIWHLVEGADALLAARPDGNSEGFDQEDDGEKPEPRVLIVTANIALQEQLIGKDIPMLRRLLPWEFEAALCKGRSNWLCLDRFDDSVAELTLEPLRDPEERMQWNQVAAWAQQTQTGDMSELPFEPLPAIKHRLTVTADDCTGKACPRYGDCHAERQRRRVKDADLIVTNYHMLFAHLAFADETGVGVLPRFDVVVLDEAHEAADIARDFFGFRITAGGVRWAIRLLAGAKAGRGKPELEPIDREHMEHTLAVSATFFEQLGEHRRSRDYYARLVKPDVVDWRPLHDALVQAVKLYVMTSEQEGMVAARVAELRRAARRAKLLSEHIAIAMRCEAEEVVFFVEEDASRRRVSLCAKPLQVGEQLRAKLFASPGIRAVIATSATLRTREDEGGFDFIAGELGADEAMELATESPFDFASQALLVIPDGLPDPSAKDFAERIAEWTSRIVGLARGKTLGLFTSFRGLNAAAAKIRFEHGDRYAVLRQGDAPRTKLIARFRDDVSSVLLGTKSFWAGVDVPGEALSVVVIDRVPFDPPDDPVLDALQDRSSRTFKEYSLPRATIELRQGFGRLIRSRSDRGVVVILDRRLRDKGWGKSILRALPPAARSTRIEDVAAFLYGDRRAAAGQR